MWLVGEKQLFQYIKKNLKKGYIRLSNARNSVEMLWVPKKGTSELRPCQNYGVQTVEPNYTGTDIHTRHRLGLPNVSTLLVPSRPLTSSYQSRERPPNQSHTLPFQRSYMVRQI